MEISKEEYERLMKKGEKKAEGVFKGVGKAGGRAVGAALGGFTRGRFKGIRHPDSLIDENTKWLYVPRHGRKRRRSMKEIYFGQRGEE